MIRRAVHLVSAVCVFASTPVISPAAVARPPETTAPDFDFKFLRARDPLLREFADQRFAPNFDDVWEARELDDNPYFMRGQTYGPALSDDADARSAFATDARAVRVQVRGTAQTLAIEAPLAPLFELDDYLFFKPTDPALFTDAARGDDASEGLFYLRKQFVRDELKRTGERRPVPIFFLPLAGGWTGHVTHVVDLSSGTLALNNGAGHSATLGLDTLDELSRTSHLNLTLALIMALKHDAGAPDAIRRRLARGETLELPNALPPRGSTYAFGTFFTGVDLDTPAAGLFRPKRRFNLDLSILPKAHALLTPDVLSSLLTTAMVMATAYTLGTLAQFTVLRPRVLARRAIIEAKRPSKDVGTFPYLLRTNVRENVDVFGNALTLLGSGFQTAGGYLAEYAFDRSGVRAARSGWLRKALENTMITTRRWTEGVNVNAKVVFLGMVVLGGIGIGALSLQLLYLSPFAFPLIAGLVSPQLQARVAADFSGANAVTNNLVTSELMYNIAMSPQNAYAYAADQRRNLMELVKPSVQRKLAREGVDPTDENAVEAEIDRRIEPMIVERGLPGDDEFLFSSPSLARGFAALMGYHVPRAELARSRDAVAGQDVTFTLERARFGLTAHAVKDALRRTSELSARHPADLDLREAVRILSEMQRRLRTLTALVANPRHAARVWREGQAVRKILTLLTLEEPVVGAGLRFIDAWKPEDPAPLERLLALETEIHDAARAAGRRVSGRRVRQLLADRVRDTDPEAASALAAVGRSSLARRLAEAREETARGLLGAAVRNPRAATLAGRAFRQNFFALTKGQTEIASPDDRDILTFGADARAEALKTLRAAPAGVTYGAADLEIETLEIIKQKVAARRLAEGQKSWAPPRADWLERRQLAAAHAAAERAVPDVGDAESQKLYREAFRVALAKQVGLRPSEDPAAGAEFTVTETARESAEAELTHNLATNENWKTYLADLSAEDKVRFVSHQYADVFLNKYTELTVGNSAFVPLTSPAQPGFFQAARQTEFARRDNWLGRATTYALRVGDSMFDATATRPGIRNWIYRRIPFAQDLNVETGIRLRAFPTFALVSWHVNYYLWGVHFNLPTMMFFWFTGGLTSIAHYWVDRILINVGVPPLEGITSQAKYAVVLEALTYLTMVPFFFFAEDFENMFGRAVDACQGLLTGAFRR